MQQPWLRKPLWAVLQEGSTLDSGSSATQQHEQQYSTTTIASDSTASITINRHLSLWDLVSVGVGGTIGSGIFVLCGSIAHHFAGPATFLSFAISGLAACFSGVCFAELAGRLPASGSTYIYAYVSMGELTAVWAAACLTLEYAVAGAAVARSWGDKVGLWIQHMRQHAANDGEDESMAHRGEGLPQSWVNNFNPMAILVSVVSLALLINGVQESKRVSNFFTALKVLLVVFLIVAGFSLFSISNITSIDGGLEPYGMAGILRGATSSFFGYLGYDEVCCLAGEALVPHRDMPRAVLLTLAIVAILYMLAAVALTGIQPFTEIDDTSGFPMAFYSRGWDWAARLAAGGEIITLPVVVLISLLAQPRLFVAMARDGLLPKLFLELKAGTWVSGIGMTLLAGFVPFQQLDDWISAGILVAFSITNTSLILLRCCHPGDNSSAKLWRALIIFHMLSFVASLLLASTNSNLKIMGGVMLPLTLWFACGMAWMFPRSPTFGGSILSLRHDCEDSNIRYFEAPGVPYIPLLGIFINWYLIAQLEWTGLILLLFYLAFTGAMYFFANRCNSRSFTYTPPWKQQHSPNVLHAQSYQGTNVEYSYEDHDDGVNEEEKNLISNISLPRMQTKTLTE